MRNKELKHYGILGMRWGVRRSEAELRRARAAQGRPRVTKEEYEAEKEKAIKSGNATKVKAWEPNLTDAELKRSIERVKLDNELNKYLPKEKTGLDRVEEAMNTVGRITKIADTGLNAYGTLAKINNTFNPVQLPTVDGKFVGDKAKEEAEKRAKDAAFEKHQAEVEEVFKLLNDGKFDEVTKNYKSYDAEAVAEAIARISYDNANMAWLQSPTTPEGQPKSFIYLDQRKKKKT